jgi:hypothetical protein
LAAVVAAAYCAIRTVRNFIDAGFQAAQNVTYFGGWVAATQ